MDEDKKSCLQRSLSAIFLSILYGITIIVFGLSTEQAFKTNYTFNYQISDCSGNYDVPDIVNHQWDWKMNQSQWYQNQELQYTNTQTKKRSTKGFCLSGAPKTVDDDNFKDEYGGFHDHKHVHTLCLDSDKLKQLDNLLVDKSLYPNGYFNLLYTSIEYLQYLSNVDFITSLICLIAIGTLPILLFNIWIESLIEIIVMDSTQRVALDIRYWSMLWPGCKVISLPDDQNMKFFNLVCSKFGLNSIFSGYIFYLIVYMFFYGILVLLGICYVMENVLIQRIKTFLWNRINDAPQIVVAQHYAFTKVYESVKNLSTKSSKNKNVKDDESKSSIEINTINPLHDNNNSDIEINNTPSTNNYTATISYEDLLFDTSL